jgi:hypothetical protein
MSFSQPAATQTWQLLTLGSAGGFVLLVSVFLIVIRKAAYIQPFSDHLRLVTPFLRLNISYKRLRRASTATMSSLFPPRSVSGWKQEIIAPLGSKTAIVVDLTGYPISQSVLRYFLSPFFFKDKTPHFVFLIEDWMRFSTELESLRVSGEVPSTPVKRRPADQCILRRTNYVSHITHYLLRFCFVLAFSPLTKSPPPPAGHTWAAPRRRSCPGPGWIPPRSARGGSPRST